MLIKKHISKGIRGSIPECTKVKDFLKAIEDQYVRSDKALASTLMKRLSDMKYNDSRSVREHIMHMRDIAAQLKPLEVDISEPFLVHLILNSLPKEYGPFKITYNAQKEKWSVNELLTMCVQEEERLKNENIEVANLVTQNKGKEKKGKFGPYEKKTDMCGPFPPCFNGQRYFVSFIDDFSRYMYLYLIFDKAEDFDAFKAYKVEVEKQLAKSIKIVRSDRGGGIMDENSKGYRFYCPHIPRIVEARNAKFLEDVETSGSNIPHKEVFEEDQISSKTPEELTVYPGYPPSIIGKQSNQEQSPTKDNENAEPSTLNGQNLDENVEVRKSSRVKKFTISSDYIVYLQESDFDIGPENDPTSFSQAMISENSNLWHDVMKEKIASMDKNQVWELTKLPEGAKTVGCKWVYKTKRDPSGRIERYKARLVAKGYTQKEGIDCRETFSPVSKNDSFRVIMALVAHFDLELYQMDVKTAFLNGDLEDKVYMSQPEGFSHDSDLVCKLKKSIYGLKQASRQWYIKFHNVVSSFGSKENIVDQCIYLKVSGSKYIFLVLYVDDILLAYIEKVLAKYRMSACSSTAAPIVKGDKFGIHQSPQNSLEENQMKNIPYASVVGSLMYVQVYTRPDIAFAVGMLGRYQSNPGIEHWKTAKKVMCYLQGTKDLQLIYKQTENLEVIGYSDSYFAGCLDTRKSTSGYIFLLANGAISWKSTKQTITASSTMGAEFVACYEATSQALWLRHFITGLKIVDSIFRPIQIFCDNSTAVFFSKNNKSGSHNKHIDIKFLVVREKVNKKETVIQHVRTELMVADPMTKALPANSYRNHVDRMGLVSPM
ncbi:UNVERIFIED_CONTAM: Retrovirus-related Pol polyprotein from transposon TNT 1-94 [Sesamum latifolium]|uniref:Retrovirus-related Pol polyprotein from transposon TNT 1-94 n=1 Tax=Sesamum latifolium TaxID=2727402 RepID=A0AAW2U485_9LAMI